MGVLEQITQMKNQGIPDKEIVRNLQEQGVSPREINDALNQEQIKNAVSDYPSEDMQTSMRNPPVPNQNQTGYIPRSQEMPQEVYAPEEEQEYFPQEQYQQGEYDYPPERVDNDIIIEIAEQVFSEKIKKIQKKIDGMDEFKTLAQTKIDSTADRLKRIEATIDKLQIAILEKIGSYGKNIEGIKREMSMMQDSFGKVVDQAVKGHHSRLTHKTNSKKRTKKK